MKKVFLKKNSLLLVFIFLSYFFINTDISADTLLPGNISTCGELAAPGTYTLTQNISGGSNTCLYISSDNIVINGGGYTISGTGNIAIDARAKTGGPTGTLTEGANAYTNLVINDLNISGYTTGLNMSGNDDLSGTGVKGGFGGDAGDAVVYYSYIGSIILDGGNATTSAVYGGIGGNIAFNDTNLNISSSTISVLGGLGQSGRGPRGGLDLNYTGTLNKENLTLSALGYFNDNTTEYGIYPGGTWPIYPGNISTCGTLYATTTSTFILTQDLVSSSTCFIIAGDNITINGSGHSISSLIASSTDWAIDAFITDNYENLVINNLNFNDFTNIINSSSTVELKSTSDLTLSGKTIYATNLVIKYIGNLTYTNTILGNITSLIINNIRYGSFSSGLLSSLGNTWVAQNLLGTGDWEQITSSADGKYVYAVSGSTTGKLFKSSDYGKTFTLVTSVPNSTYLGFVATSANGKYVLLTKTTSTTDVYVSNDYGNTWTLKNTGHGSIRSAAVSADGSKMITVSWDRKVTFSSDYGANWSIQNTSNYIYWESIKGDADFSRLMAIGGVGNVLGTASGYIYTSSDYGVTWATSTVAGFRTWKDIDISADRNKIIATTGSNSTDGYVYVSSDGGTTWATSTLGLKRWTSANMTSDGEFIIVSATNLNYIFTSSNGGTTWATSTTSLGTKNWATSHITKDGSRMFAAVSSEYLYSFTRFNTEIHNAIISPVASSTYQEWNPVVVWGSASDCYYSYDNWTSTSTANCSLNGTDISMPPIGNQTLYIRSYGTGGVFEKNINFNFSGTDVEIISPSNTQSYYTKSTWAPNVNYNKENRLNISSCYYSYDNWTSTSTANCSLNGADIVSPSTSGQGVLYIKVIDDEGGIHTANKDFVYEIDYLYGASTIVGTKIWQQIYTLSDPKKMVAAATDYIYTSSDFGLTWATSTLSLGTKLWEFVTASSDGSKIFATVNNEYIYRSTDYGLSWSAVSTALGTKDWNSIAVTADGVNVYAAVFNNYIYKSTDSGTTWSTSTLSLGTKLWYDVAVTPDNAVVFAVSDTGYLYKSIDGGTTWSTSTAFISTKSWRTVAVSEDGTKAMAAANNDYIYKTTNGGFTWSTSTLSLGTKNWNAIEMSTSGDKVVASVSGGYTYVSTDFGTTWATSTWVGTNNWNGVTVTKDGSGLVAYLNSNIYRSTDNGLSWLSGHLNYSWQSSAISSSGNFLIMANSSSGYVYTSTDGLNWVERQGTGAKSWYDIAASSDGQTIVAAASGNYVFVSNNGGTTWATSTLSLGTKNWRSVAASGDGSVLYAGVGSGAGYIYKSSNGGTTWATSTASGLRQWYGIDTNSDGSKVVAVANGGYLYTSTNGGTTWATSTTILAQTSGLYDVAMSEDGMKIVAVGSDFTNGYVVVSNDGGLTWTRQIGLGSKYWTSTDITSDGNIIRVVARDPDPGYIYTSYDGGLTWIEHVGFGNKDWYSISMSSDGKKFIAASTNNSPYFYNGNIDMLDFIVTNPIEGDNYSTSNWNPQINFNNATSCYYSYDNWFSSTTINCANNGSDIVDPPISGSLVLSIKAVSANGSEREKDITISFNNTNYVYQWIQKTLAGSYVWRGIVISLDGLRLAAIAGNNYIHTSSNGGSTWLTSTSILGTKGWYDIAASYDGNKIMGVTYGNYIYKSSNGGTAWATSTQSLGVKNWRSVALSGNGNNAIAAVDAGNLYYSFDFGTNWATSTSAGSRSWRAIASSFDGSKMFASVWNGHIYKSTDSGVTWSTTTTSLGAKNWYEMGVSADGNIIYATIEASAYMYKSMDGGNTWATTTSLGVGYWGDVKTSADGSRVIVAKYSDYTDSVYISEDYGNTWSAQSVFGPKNIQAVNISMDGTKFFVGNARAATNATGYIYTTQKTPAEVNVDILSPSSSSTVSVWGPIVSWGAATQCYYSYDNWVSSSTANCELGGSDILVPDSVGQVTLYVKGVNSLNTSTDNRTFDLQAYYFCGTSDAYWSNVANWYTGNNCSINTGLLPSANDIAALVGSISPIINSSVTTLPLKIISSTLSGAANAVGVIFADSAINSTKIAGNATFNDNSSNNGIIVGNMTVNTDFYNGSIPITNTLNISDWNSWSGEVKGTVYASDGVTPIIKYVFGNGGGNYGTIHADVDFNGQTIMSLGTITGTTTLNGTNQFITYNQNNYLNNLIKISNTRETLFIGPDVNIQVSGLFKLRGLDQNNLLTIQSNLPGLDVNLDIQGDTDFNYLRLRDINNSGDVINLTDKVVFDDGNNVGFVFPTNSSSGSRGGITGSYTPPSLPPSRGGVDPNAGNNNNSNNNNVNNNSNNTNRSNTSGGSSLLKDLVKNINPLDFTPIQRFDVLNNINNFGSTVLPNPLANISPIVDLQLTKLPINFLSNLFKFAVDSNQKNNEALYSGELISYVYKQGIDINRAQDLAKLQLKPVILNSSVETPKDVLRLKVNGNVINSYISYDSEINTLVQKVRLPINQNLNISTNLQDSQVIRYMNQRLIIDEEINIQTPDKKGLYRIESSFAIPLVMEVFDPNDLIVQEKTSWFSRLKNWFYNKFSNIF